MCKIPLGVSLLLWVNCSASLLPNVVSKTECSPSDENHVATNHSVDLEGLSETEWVRVAVPSMWCPIDYSQFRLSPGYFNVRSLTKQILKAIRSRVIGMCPQKPTGDHPQIWSLSRSWIFSFHMLFRTVSFPILNLLFWYSTWKLSHWMFPRFCGNPAVYESSPPLLEMRNCKMFRTVPSLFWWYYFTMSEKIRYLKGKIIIWMG